MPVEQGEHDPARTEKHNYAIGRWENEGGTTDRAFQHQQETVAGEIGDVEAGHLRVRLIALENVVIALLAGAPEGQSDLVREMANYISPRPGATPHRMTIEAASHMVALVNRAAHYKDPQP